MSVWAKSLGCSAQAIKSRVVAGIAHHGPRVAWIVGMQTYAALKTLLLYISTAACSLALAVRNLLVSEWFCSFVRHAVSAMLALLCAAMTAVFQHRSEGHAAEERIQVSCKYHASTTFMLHIQCVAAAVCNMLMLEMNCP